MDLSIEDQLYDAISKNDVSNVKKNLRKDVNINTVCSSGLTPLGAAAHLGNVAICETLIEKYHREEEYTIPKNKKLCLSLINNDRSYKNEHKNVGYFIVKKDLDTNNDETIDIGDGPTPEGMEALEWDVEIKDTDELTVDESYSSLYQWYADILNRTSDLLKTPLPCDINQIDRYGRTALHYASDQGHTSVVQLLISAGCNVNHTSSDSVSPLHLACSTGHSDVVLLLLKAGARVNHITNIKSTPLHFASLKGHVKIMQILLQSGANVNALDASDHTPLVQAVSQQNLKAVELLVRYGARVNIEDINGYTPLCEAVWINSIPIVQILISAGAKITQSHYLLHFSVSNNQIDIAKLLVTAGSVVNLRDDSGNTPLILAVRHGYMDAAKYLLDHGAVVNLPNTVTGCTPLYEAVEYINDFNYDKFKSILDLLFNRGADLEVQSNWETPLFHAIFLEKTHIASILIRYGANVNFCDPRINVDNLCIARKNNNLQIAKMLIYAGYDLKNATDIQRFSDLNDQVHNIFNWLVYTKYNPLLLMDLCRIKIRKLLGKKVYFKTNCLGLPKQLVNFLNLEH